MYGIGLEHHGQILQTVAEMVEAGRLTPHVSQTFALEDLAEAHRLQETGHVTGKVGIQVR
jgi:NADPH:quinone reductase-like Zn-dependent oxidoreductase